MIEVFDMNHKRILKAVLCISAMGTLNTTTIIMPIMDAIQRSFSEVSPALVSLMFTLPSLLMIPALVICGKLCQSYSKKKIIVFGYILMGAAGIATGLFHNITIMLLMRCLVGVSSGLIAPVYSSLYADYYTGHDLMKMNGLGNGVGALIGIVMSLLSGLIASVNWRASFWLYGFCIIVALLQILFLPKTKSDTELAREVSSRNTETGSDRSYVWDVLKICVFAYLIITIATPFNFQISGYIIQEGMGNNAVAGIVSSIITFGMFLSGVLFTPIHKRIHRYIFVLMPALVGVCYIGLFSSEMILPVAVLSLLMGLGNILILPSVSYECIRIAPIQFKTIIISIGTAAIFLGQFSGNFVPGVIEKMVGLTDLRMEFKTLGEISLVIAVAICITNLIAQKNAKKRKAD